MSEPSTGEEPRSILAQFPGIDLLTSDNFAIHTHGGPPADVRAVKLHFEVHDHRAHTIEARRIELLRRQCREDAWSERKQLVIVNHHARADGAEPKPKPVEGTATVVIPPNGPRSYKVRVEVEPVGVYQTCDAFAFGIEIVVDRIPRRLVIPLNVEREEPDER